MKRRTTGLLMMDSPKYISEYDVHSSGKTKISFLCFLFYSNFNNWNPFYDVLPLDKLEIKFPSFLIIFRFCCCGLLFLLCGDKQKQLSTSSSDLPAKKKSTGRQQATWRKMDGWRLAVDFLLPLGTWTETRALWFLLVIFFSINTEFLDNHRWAFLLSNCKRTHKSDTLVERSREERKPQQIQKLQNIHGRKSSTTDRECQMNWRHSTCKTEANEICFMFSNRNCGAKVVFVDVSRGERRECCSQSSDDQKTKFGSPSNSFFWWVRSGGATNRSCCCNRLL